MKHPMNIDEINYDRQTIIKSLKDIDWGLKELLDKLKIIKLQRKEKKKLKKSMEELIRRITLLFDIQDDEIDELLSDIEAKIAMLRITHRI